MRYGTNYIDADVLCPFYTGTGGREIVCEASVDRASNILRFRRGEDYMSFIRCRCCKDYKSCDIYRATMRKYEEEPDRTSFHALRV